MDDPEKNKGNIYEAVFIVRVQQCRSCCMNIPSFGHFNRPFLILSFYGSDTKRQLCTKMKPLLQQFSSNSEVWIVLQSHLADSSDWLCCQNYKGITKCDPIFLFSTKTFNLGTEVLNVQPEFTAEIRCRLELVRKEIHSLKTHPLFSVNADCACR